MSYCPVSASITKYYNDIADGDYLADWVEEGTVICPTCSKCNLIFSTFERAPASTCGRCSEPSNYPWVDGKRAKWTGGVIMDIDNANPPCADYGDDY